MRIFTEWGTEGGEILFVGNSTERRISNKFAQDGVGIQKFGVEYLKSFAVVSEVHQ